MGGGEGGRGLSTSLHVLALGPNKTIHLAIVSKYTGSTKPQLPKMERKPGNVT